MKVIVPVHADMDFDFNSARASPCNTAPSTPKPVGGGYYLSAPASPSHLSGFYRDFHDFRLRDDGGPVDAAGKYSVPETSNSVSGAPKSDDFSFDVEVVRERAASSVSAAEELFERGMIKPLNPPPPSVTRSSSSSSKGAMVKKWRLRDLFLFRSASEGRASEKDPLKKYTAAVGASFRGENREGSRRRRSGGVSAHEMHYTMNRAVSEDMKKRTFLPYKEGILGRLAVNPAVHALANGFGISRKQ
ncbi:unnamed protein product [Cuscuta campestris]|uniref:Uncharacterized protein n=1 Tax=Cuscuta campestris TaxID=132261 RepID=A0A484NDY9_9ASTE|nr:unnamed protein product [Cuscuta campestris]